MASRWTPLRRERYNSPKKIVILSEVKDPVSIDQESNNFVIVRNELTKIFEYKTIDIPLKT
jgi:hypothetical protein